MKALRLGFVSSLGFAAAIASAQYAGSQPVPEAYRRGFESITIADAKDFLGFLAGPECMGRGTGQPGYQVAANYVAQKFLEFGLKPVADNGSYFQNLTFVRTSVHSGESRLVLGGATVEVGKGLSLSGVTAGGELTGPIVFVNGPEGNEGLPEGVSVEGAIVVFRGAGRQNRARTAVMTGSPAAILTMVDEVVMPEPSVRLKSGQAGRQRATRPTGQISRQAAESLMAAAGVDPSVFNGASEVKVVRGSGDAKLTYKLDSQDILVPNVIGLLEGSDPVLKEEVVGIGSHLDHLGVQNGVVYWGADDDGSGSTAILQIAKAMSVNPVKPKRSILFMAFAAEEMGLIGSGFYADNPIFPHSKMICELQMDMVGRNEEKPGEPASENIQTIHLVGSKRISTELDDLVNEANKYVNFTFEYDEEGVYTRSDHYNFAKHGIPIAFLFSGFHPDYHQPTDTVDKINFEKLTNSSKLFYLVAMMAANREGRFKPNEGGGQ